MHDLTSFMEVMVWMVYLMGIVSGVIASFTIKKIIQYFSP
jgi:hypothetical protein